MAPQHEPTLHVLSGLHAGAVFVLRDGAVRIGSGKDADVVLADEGILAEHAVVEAAEGTLRFTALADGVALDGCPVAVGDALAAAPPFEFGIAGVLFRCDGPAPAAAPPRAVRRVSKRWIAAGCALALSAAGVAVLAAVPAAGGVSHPSAPGTAAPDPAAPLPGVNLDPDAVQREMGAKLAEAGLTGIQVAVNGTVATVSGRLDPAALPRWRAVEAWVDQRYGRRLLLVPAVAVEAARPMEIVLDAVWSGPNPNVVARGERYAVGATLPGGWQIEAIEAGRVLLKKGGQTHALPY